MKVTLAAIVLVLIIGIILSQSSGQPTPTNEQTQKLEEIALPFEEIGLFDPVPEEIRKAPPEFRRRWIEMHNAEVVRRAQLRASEYQSQHPKPDVHVQTQRYTGTNTLDQQESGGYFNSSLQATARTNYNGSSTHRVYQPDRWGGGPVVIINPYAD